MRNATSTCTTKWTFYGKAGFFYTKHHKAMKTQRSGKNFKEVFLGMYCNCFFLLLCLSEKCLFSFSVFFFPPLRCTCFSIELSIFHAEFSDLNGSSRLWYVDLQRVSAEPLLLQHLVGFLWDASVSVLWAAGECCEILRSDGGDGIWMGDFLRFFWGGTAPEKTGSG